MSIQSQGLVDHVWLLLCTALVFIMQAGFLCLEAGITRSKNSINVAIKNLVTFGVVTMLFWCFAFGLAFGDSDRGLWGTHLFLLPFETSGGNITVIFIYQLMFAATSTVIISGAVAERIKYSAYLFLTLLSAGLIYPIFCHWVNAGALSSEKLGWLGKRGFVDFAGSTSVHSIGGWMALAALMVIGPRTNRFAAAKVNDIPSSNMPLAILGTMLLFFGWIGFNGGSFLVFDDRVPSVVANTLLAGSAGMMTALIVSWLQQGRSNVMMCMNGGLAGMVAITANSHVVGAIDAIAIGSIGCLVAIIVEIILLRCKIDDAVGAVPVHLGAGIWGTFAVALFGDATRLNNGLNWVEQLREQTIGVLAAALWAFGLTYIVLKLIHRWHPLRVSDANEMVGLNVSEHGSTTEWVTLVEKMDQQVTAQDWSRRMPEEPFTEVGLIARKYNAVVQAFENALIQTRNAAQMAGLGEMAGGIAHEINNPLMVIEGRADQLQSFAMRGLLTNELMKEMTQDISETTARISAIVRSLRKLARKEGRAELKPTSVSEILQDTAALCQARFAANGVKLTLPKVSTDLMLECNGVEISQALLNIFNNAFDAVKNAAEKTVHLEISDSADFIEFAVSNSGESIPKDLQAKIFEPFFTTKTAGQGTGLGLALVQRFVDHHGGRVFLDRDARQTRFVIRLPKVHLKDGEA